MGWRRILKTVLVVAGINAAILGCLYGGVAYLVLKQGLLNIPPQDCMGSTFSLKGSVTTAQGAALAGAEILAHNNGSFEKPAFHIHATSDERGYFETTSVFSYACTPFEVDVTAPGYQKQTLTLYPPGESWPDELPDRLNIILLAVEPSQQD